MKSLLSLIALGTLGLSTQVMASATYVEHRNDRVQVSNAATATSLQVERVIQRNDRMKLKKLVTTDINKFSQYKEVLREQRNDRVSIVRHVNS
ncbi:hypothetical protein [uncultured Acinetobacter sp.]|uniref:hypothetical protein n=1 Tax=uncultured Acinetobacter sp. TaxID=165433 RepID=UPI00262BE09D|nr:hypothetical protein [uncultured Acinetobacter sp.]